MGVLLRFRDAKLRLAQPGKVFAQRVRQRFGGIDHGEAGEGLVILGHGDELDGDKAALAHKALEIRHDEGAGELARTVGAEVEEDDAVARLHGRHGLSVLHDDGGLHELVRDVVLIAVLDRLHGVSLLHALAQGDGIVAQLHALPDVVAVHAEIAPLDAGNFAHADFFELVLQLLHVHPAAGRRHIAPVQHAMHIDLFEAAHFRHFNQRIQMRVVAVDAAVRQKTHQMKGAAVFLHLVHRVNERLLFEKFSVLNVLGDAGQLLIHDAPRADVQVADLAVAHLSVRQTHIHAACAKLRMREARRQPVQIGRALRFNGVASGFLVDTEAIHDDQSSDLRHMFFTPCQN